jgi:hypothetical protein
MSSVQIHSHTILAKLSTPDLKREKHSQREERLTARNRERKKDLYSCENDGKDFEPGFACLVARLAEVVHEKSALRIGSSCVGLGVLARGGFDEGAYEGERDEQEGRGK